MDLVTPAIGLGLGYIGLKALGVLPSTPAAAAAGAAPVPAAQAAAAAAGAAPAIPGHVIPTPPEPSSSGGDPYAFLNRIALPPGYSTDFLPRVQQGSGLWVDGTQRPYQFSDPNTGAPMGVAGYMPIEYAAHLAATHTAGDDVSSSSSSSSSSDSSGGGLPPWAGSALAAGGTAIVAGVASGTGAAAAVGTAAAAALAALGPVPGVVDQQLGGRAYRTSTNVETLVVEDGAGRVLGVNIVRTPAGWGAVAIETSAAAAKEHGPTGLAGMYADHAHVVIGVFPTHHAADAAGVLYGERWLGGKKAAPCECPEIAAVPA